MVSNFELLMDFKNVRDFAICMSKNNICCHHKTYYNYECENNDTEDACRRCWLDFLTGDKGLDLSYLDKEEPIESKTSPIKLSEKSMQILKEKKNGKERT